MDWEPARNASGGGKEKHRGGCLSRLFKVLVGLVAICVVVWFFWMRPPKLTWPSTGLAAMLPTPETMHGEIRENSDERFSADLEEFSSDDYWSYLDACKERGFTVDARQEGSTSYTAYSQDGYALELTFRGDSLDVSLDAPDEMEPIDWPQSGAGALVPAPAPDVVGIVEIDSARRFEVLVGEMGPGDFLTYCDALAAAGFTIDYSRDNESYRAYDKAGNLVSANYEGFSTVSILVIMTDGEGEDAISMDGDVAAEPLSGESQPVPDEEQPEEDVGVADPSIGSETAAATSVDAGTASEVDPAFKKTMDEYEAFFDEYVDFMLRYGEGDASPQMLVDYSAMMARYAEMMQGLEDIDSSNLSVADAAYYTEVMARITARLAELSV